MKSFYQVVTFVKYKNPITMFANGIVSVDCAVFARKKNADERAHFLCSQGQENYRKVTHDLNTQVLPFFIGGERMGYETVSFPQTPDEAIYRYVIDEIFCDDM